MKKLFVLILLCPYMVLSGQQIEKEIEEDIKQLQTSYNL